MSTQTRRWPWFPLWDANHRDCLFLRVPLFFDPKGHQPRKTTIFWGLKKTMWLWFGAPLSGRPVKGDSAPSARAVGSGYLGLCGVLSKKPSKGTLRKKKTKKKRLGRRGLAKHSGLVLLLALLLPLARPGHPEHPLEDDACAIFSPGTSKGP